MGTTYAAPATAFRMRRVGIGLMAAAAVTMASGVAIATRLDATLNSSAVEGAIVRPHPGYGTGYPQHGGLAGPSGVRSDTEHPGYGVGYPQHGGLAGPSGVRSDTEHPGYGVGYPQHGGLAGPGGDGTER